MSVLSRHRLILGCALLLIAQALFADNPSAITGPRMVYVPETGRMVLFGGETVLDAGTRLAYDLDQTWQWIGTRWVHVYPAHSPSPRSLQAMVYDSARRKTFLFGGRYATLIAGTSVLKNNFLGDTWAYDGSDWSQVETASAPSARMYPAADFDPIRNKTVLYGGAITTLDASNTVTTVTNYNDTWEFDGQNWTQTGSDGPKIDGPIMVWDAARSQMLLMGTTDAGTVLMYSYQPSNGSWQAITPPTLPDCVNSASMVYQSHDQKVVLFGGTCTLSSTIGDTWEWDGTTWTKVTTTILRTTGEAMAYDPVRHQTIMFGGTVAFGAPQSGTFVYSRHTWSAVGFTDSPSPRSLVGFATDPVSGSIWLYSGLNDAGNLDDFWQYRNGTWSALPITNGPVSCISPGVAYDSDRARLVVVCADSTLFEWDGSVWKQALNLKTTPPARRFSSATYDPSLKKFVLFGGYEDNIYGYINETWLWDGTSWTQQRNNTGPRRSLAALWFDPVLKKTVLFGGIGQSSKDARIDRYNDMWALDSTGWKQITLSGDVPAPRYGALTAVDPQANTVLLFGGLKLDVSGVLQSQVYANDTWQWDGAKWTELQPASVPPVRENGGMAFDPTTNQLVMFGGYAGYYLGDLWGWTGSNWVVRGGVLPPSSPQRRLGPR